MFAAITFVCTKCPTRLNCGIEKLDKIKLMDLKNSLKEKESIVSGVYSRPVSTGCQGHCPVEGVSCVTVKGDKSLKKIISIEKLNNSKSVVEMSDFFKIEK